MDAEKLDRAIIQDKKKGYVPACVVGTVGSTGSTAIDPIRKIGEICRREKIFFHVDAAFAGNAAILPEKRQLLDGVELADSFVFNPHKWLYANFDCSAFYVKDVELLLGTCAIEPEYLKTKHDSQVENFRDWGIQLGRRFRALKLWWVIRSFGVEGLQAKIREGIRLAQLFRSWVEKDSRFEVMAPSPVSLVCFRRVQPEGSEEELERINSALLARINESGVAYLSHTKLSGRYALRLNTSQERTTEEDVREVWRFISRAGDGV